MRTAYTQSNTNRHTLGFIQEIDYRHALLQQCERVSCIYTHPQNSELNRRQHPLTIPVNSQIKSDSYLICTCQHTVQVKGTHRVSRSDKGNQRIRHEIQRKCQTEKQLKVELAELEKRKRDIFWDVEYAMFSAGIKYFNTCSEYWLYKLESEYIKAEKEYLSKPTDI